MGLYWGKYPTAYVIEETEDGYYMADGNGFMLTADELLDIAKNITKFAKLHKKDIEEFNIENKKRFNREINDFKKHTKERNKTTDGYIYIMESQNKYKIGYSKNVERRLKEISNSPFEVKLIYKSNKLVDVVFVEKELHKKFEEKRINREWFDLTEYDIEVIKYTLENCYEECN